MVFIAVILLFSACNKDEKNIEENILGIWNIEQIESTNCDDSKDNINVEISESGCTEYDFDKGCLSAVFTFTDAAFIYNETFENRTINAERFDYTILEDEIIFCEGTDCFDAVVKVSNGTLSLTFNDPGDGCTRRLVGKK